MKKYFLREIPASPRDAGGMCALPRDLMMFPQKT